MQSAHTGDERVHRGMRSPDVVEVSLVLPYVLSYPWLCIFKKAKYTICPQQRVLDSIHLFTRDQFRPFLQSLPLLI